MRRYYDDYERGFRIGRRDSLRESLGSPINITYEWAKNFLKKFTSKTFKLDATHDDVNLSGYVGRTLTHDIAFHFENDEFNGLQISVQGFPNEGTKGSGTCAFYDENGKLVKENVGEFLQDWEYLQDKYSNWIKNDEDFAQICKELKKIIPGVKL